MKRHLSRKHWLYQCSFILLLSLYYSSFSWAQCDVIYASPTGLTTNDGSEANPVDLQTALTQACAQNRKHIRLLSGTYNLNQKMVIACNDLIIDGNWEVVLGVGRKNSSLTTTINIDALLETATYDGNIASSSVGYYIGVEAIGQDNQLIQDITFNVKNGGLSGTAMGTTGDRGNSIYGFYFRNSNGWHLERCTMNTGSGSRGSNGNNGTPSTNGTPGGTGGNGHCDNNSASTTGGSGGAAVGAGIRRGGNGGSGGRGSDDGSSNNADGLNGGNGGGGALAGNSFGTKGANGGCGTDCNRDGRAGENGASGTNGSNGTALAVSTTFDLFWLPSGKSGDGTDGTGGAGGEGGGGGGRQAGFFCDNGPGGGGGGGGGGGEGGQRGTGGWGSGGSFALYLYASSGTRNNVNLATNTAPLGGTKGLGATGGIGGNHGRGGGGNNINLTGGGSNINTRVCNDCEVGAGGRGGRGGNGGKGGDGADGANGLSEPVRLVNGGSVNTTTTPSITQIITNQPLQGCQNSEIIITKNTGTWGLPASASFINNLDNSTSSYTTASNPAIVSYNTTGSQSISIDGVNYPGFIQINTARALPTFDPAMPSTICEGQNFTMNTPATASEYEWILFEGANNTTTPTGIYNTKVASFATPVTGLTVHYHLRLRVKDDCCGWSAPVYFDFDAIPTTAGPTVTLDTVCAGESATISTTGTGTLNWYSDALGQINLASGPAPTLALNTSILNQNTVFYASQSVGSCTGPLTAAEVIVHQLPNQPSTNPIVVCSGEDVILAATGSGSGDLVFYDNSLTEIGRTTMSSGSPNAVLNLGALAVGSHSYYVREDNGTCESTLNLIGVTVQALPNAPMASNQSICANSSTTLTATGTGTLNWYADATLTTLLNTGNNYTTGNLNSSTNYYITQTNANGCESAATMLSVTVHALPSAPVATTDTICAGQTANLMATGSGGTINWYVDPAATSLVGTGSTFSTPPLSQQTSYYVQEVSANNCSSNMTTLTVLVNPLPQNPTANAVSICQGQDAILSATGSGSGDLVFYDHNLTEIARVSMTGTNPVTFNAGALTAGNYTFYTAEDNGDCTSGRVAIPVVVHNLPATPTATDVSICAGESASLMAAGSVHWYDDANLNNLVATTNTFSTGSLTTNHDFYVVATNSHGCFSPADTASVTVHALPPMPNTTSDTICAGNTANLMATHSGGTLHWYSDPTGMTLIDTGANISIPLVNQTTTYYVQETAISTGCKSPMAASTILVHTSPNPPSASDVVVCAGSDVILSAIGSGNGDLVFYDNNNTEVGRYTMSIANPSGTVNLGALAVGSHVFFVAEALGDCYSSLSSIQVEVRQLPSAPTAFNDSPVCEGEDVFVQANTIAGATYHWTGPNGFSSTLQNFSLANVTTAEAGTYYVSIHLNGCASDSAATTITVHNRPVLSALNSNSPLCELDDLSITTAAISGATYSWTGPNGFTSTNQNINISAVQEVDHQGFYSLIATDANGCSSLPMSTLVMITALPDAGLATNNSPVCIGQDLKLHVQEVFGATYNWTGPNGFSSTDRSPILTATAADTGAYTVEVTVNNCTSTYHTFVEVRPAPTISTIADTSTSMGVPLQLWATGGVAYQWSAATNLDNANIPNPIFTPSATGTTNYLVTAYDALGCMDSKKVSITVHPAAIEELKIIDLFTPNGDGINDYWSVDFLQDPTIGSYTLQIVSRGGMEILRTQNYQNNWDGTYQEQDLPDGTYWYIIHLEDSNQTIKGAVTIKR